MKIKALMLLIVLILTISVVSGCNNQNDSSTPTPSSIEESTESEDSSEAESVAESSQDETSENSSHASEIRCADELCEYIFSLETGYGIYKTTYKIENETILLADGRTLPMHYSEYNYNEQSDIYEAVINGRKYRLHEFTDEEGRLCQMLYDCEEGCEKPDHTTLCYYPELEYGEIKLAFEIESVEEDCIYTFKFNDGYTATVSIVYDEENGEYHFAG